MDLYTFGGSPAEVGRAQGVIDPAYAREQLGERMEKRHNLDHPYFRKNMAFMRQEFPEFVEEMEAFGAAAGIERFDHTYFLHTKDTGREADGCSAFGILLKEDGPALLATLDVCHPGREGERVDETVVKVFPDLKPHGLVGIGSTCSVTVWRSVNDAGLMLGSASGHPKFHWPDNPEHLHLQFQMRLLGQYCGDCDDVRHFLKQYRISGGKGTNGTAVDAGGNMLGFELESENIAFREPEEGMVLEVNHWQHPDLQAPSRVPRADFWQSPYYYNSQNRIQYLAYYRERFKGMATLDELIDFSFDVHAPGRILQVGGHNVADWVTSHALFMTARDRKMRVYAWPLDKERYDEVRYPVCEVA